MPDTPRENTAKWDDLAEIHYYSYFITSWISFNSWYNFSFPDINSDRAIINHIKNKPSNVKRRFLELLTGEKQENKQFQENIGQLHFSLQNHNISFESQRIWFSDFFVELDRSNTKIEQVYQTLPYFVEITLSNGEITLVKATIKNADSTKTLFTYEHKEYDLTHLKSLVKFQSLTRTQQSSLEGFLILANPKKKISLISDNLSSDCIKVGQFKLINDENLIFKAIIEILYCLRNLLFHGHLTPSSGANNVYEAAYRILKQLVEGLR